MLALPQESTSGSAAAPNEAAVAGVWNVGSASIVGWRVQQVILGQLSPLVGRTSQVWGRVTIAGDAVTEGSFTVDMAGLTSSLSQTTRRTVFDIAAYPTATVVLTRPIELGAIPREGMVERFPATAAITLHGVSRTVNVSILVERTTGDNIYVLADITFPYGQWGISAQGVPFLADLQSPATIEVLLRLNQGAGNPATVTASHPAHPGGSI
jgi:polyisoprenoid-binding protein YceI